MNNSLAIWLYNKIVQSGLAWVDLVAGLVRTQTEEVSGSDGNLVAYRYPVATVHNQSGCEGGVELPLIPDGYRRSMIYFEDGGTTDITWLGRKGYQSSVRLVFWCNRSNMVADGYNEALVPEIQSQLISLLAPRRHENTAGMQRILGEVVRIPGQDSSVFSRYSYKETDRQYLRPPYDFFASDFTFRFNPASGCVTPVTYGAAICQ